MTFSTLHFPLRIAGREVASVRRASITQPYDGAPVGTVALADVSQAMAAAEHARALFLATRQVPAHERIRWLHEVATLLRRDRAIVAELIAREAGKPITLARAEVERALVTWQLGAEEAGRLGGELLPLDATPAGEGRRGLVARVPSGPVIAFAPFNFPLNLVCHKLAPALAVGAPVVLKPPPQAPLTSCYLETLLREAGVPDGMMQVVPCDPATARELVAHPAFAVFSFTGSAAAGFLLQGLAGRKRVLLELGGNAAAIVHDDADLDHAAARIVAGAFAYAGQVCIKTQRLFFADAIYDRFVADLVRRTRDLSTSFDPLDPLSVVGPLIDEAAAVRVDTGVDEAVAAGARPLLRGVRAGNRLPPVIVEIDGPGEGLRVVDEEAFGPVLTVHRTSSFDEALAWANRGRYGLQAGVFTRDIGRIRQAFTQLDVGGVIVNDAPTFRVDAMPYGGVRDSGLGREGVRYAIEELTERKVLVVS